MQTEAVDDESGSVLLKVVCDGAQLDSSEEGDDDADAAIIQAFHTAAPFICDLTMQNFQ